MSEDKAFFKFRQFLDSDTQAINELLSSDSFLKYSPCRSMKPLLLLNKLKNSLYVLEFTLIKAKSSQENKKVIVGFAYLYNVDYLNRHSYFNFFFCDMNDSVNVKANLSLVIRNFFNQHNFHRLFCEVLKDNPLYSFLTGHGFEIAGCLSESLFFDGDYHDTFILCGRDSAAMEVKAVEPKPIADDLHSDISFGKLRGLEGGS